MGSYVLPGATHTDAPPRTPTHHHAQRRTPDQLLSGAMALISRLGCAFVLEDLSCFNYYLSFLLCENSEYNGRKYFK
ncbi:unnamed protein product, partial [Brenthis ino]